MSRIDLTQYVGGYGGEMYELIETLYPLCRSITGKGVRDTLSIIKSILPIDVHEVETGKQAFDWIVPKEWNINDAYILDPAGNKIIDFKVSNLHVLNYSSPVSGRVSGKELKEHTFTIPEHPDWVPYRTSYYSESWGFCMSHNQYKEIVNDAEYEVLIDSELKDGHLTYGEYFKRGRSEKEILISCHICHPSLCNDNLSGIALAAYLAKIMSDLPTYYSYRFLFIPGTIGSIVWLSRNETKVENIEHGLVVVCVGDEGEFMYKKSRQGNSEIDKVVLNILKNTEKTHKIIDFYPYGYDERQYCSPGFDLHVGSLSRTSHGEYPEYHTSADDLSFVSPENLSGSLDKYLLVLDALENNHTYLNTNPKCEPQLGRRGLYGHIGAENKKPIDTMTILWVLNLSDGKHSLLDISERAAISFDDVKTAAEILADHGLLERATSGL